MGLTLAVFILSLGEPGAIQLLPFLIGLFERLACWHFLAELWVERPGHQHLYLVRRPARALGDLSCGAFMGAPCTAGSQILEADRLWAWAVSRTALILRVRATDAAGNQATHDVGVLPFDIAGGITDVLPLNRSLNRGDCLLFEGCLLFENI